MRSILLLGCLVADGSADRLGDCKATFKLPNGKSVGEFSGKMKVPQAPARSEHWMTFWPSIGSPLIQTCLDWGIVAGKWSFDTQTWGCKTGWHCSKSNKPDFSKDDCGGRYCDLQVHSGVSPGDTVSFSFRRTSSSFIGNNGTNQGRLAYEVNFKSSGGASSRLVTYTTTEEPPTKITGVMCEQMPDFDDTSNRDLAPRSPLELWDLVVKDQNGQLHTPNWNCQTKNHIDMDCNWKSGGKEGIQVTFPGSPHPTPSPRPSPSPQPSPAPTPTPSPAPSPSEDCTFLQDTMTESYTGKEDSPSEEECCTRCAQRAGCESVVFQNNKCKWADKGSKQVTVKGAVLCVLKGEAKAAFV